MWRLMIAMNGRLGGMPAPPGIQAAFAVCPALPPPERITPSSSRTFDL
jgi:hypothetical protein